MKKIFAAVCFVLALCLSSVHADPLAVKLDTILSAPALRGGITGAVLIRVKDGKVLYSHNAAMRLLPASNRKLFTAASALGVLGDSFHYTTLVRTESAKSADGTITGDVYLCGDGDSALTTADLDNLAAQVKQRGIAHITGRIYGDGRAFTGPPYGFGWEWDDFADEEFPKISGLEVNHGDVAITITAGPTPGSLARVQTDPPAPVVPMVHAVPTTPLGPDAVHVTGIYGSVLLNIFGTIAVGDTVKVNAPVDNPPLYAAGLFRAQLIKAGITVDGDAATGSLPPAAQPTTPGLSAVPGYYYIEKGLDASKVPTPIPGVLAVHTSRRMTDYLPQMMKPSDNLIAESLIRTMGMTLRGVGDYDNGHALELPFFSSIGVNINDIDLQDGCGVSRRDFVTARSVGQLLLGMAKRPDFQAYYNALPIAGVDGTLAKRFLNTRAAGNVHAKTGTLSQARALSGYFTGKNHQLYAFSLIMNNYPGSAKSAGDVQDKFVNYLVGTL